MKRKPTQRSLLLVAACLCSLPLLNGCVPCFYRTLRSSEVSGTVLDARTHSPVKGARVVQLEEVWIGPGKWPNGKRRETLTDAAGRFVLPASHQFHWARSVDGDVPQERYYKVVRISYPDYLQYEVQSQIYWEKNITVLLQPAQSLEVTGRVLDSRTMAAIAGARVELRDGGLECRSDSTGHFRLAATSAFYKAFRASEASGWPFRDEVYVEGGFHYVTFHCGTKEDVHEDVRTGTMLVQLGE